MVQLPLTSGSYPLDMNSCAYCGKPSTMKIVSVPQDVCAAHGVEFWTGLLAYAREQSAPCRKHNQAGLCRACDEDEALLLREVAIRMAGPSPSPPDREPYQVPCAAAAAA